MTLASWMVQQFQGRGKRIVRVDPIQGPVLVVIDIRSSGHSAVWSLDGNGGKCELHVNRVGNYSGTTILNEDVPVVAFDVDTEGTWDLRILPLGNAPTWSGTDSSGTGSSVLWLSEATDGGLSSFQTLRAYVYDNEHCAIWVHGNGKDLAFNDVGPYNGEAIMPTGSVLVEIQTDSRWALQRY